MTRKLLWKFSLILIRILSASLSIQQFRWLLNSGILVKFNKDFDQNYLQALNNHGIVILEVAVALGWLLRRRCCSFIKRSVSLEIQMLIQKKKKIVNVLKHLKFFCQCFKTFEKKKNSNVVQHLKKKKNSNVVQHKEKFKCYTTFGNLIW